MKNMSPEDIKRQMEAVQNQGSAQQQYYYNVRPRSPSRGDSPLVRGWRPDARCVASSAQASEMLKTQGNALVKCVCVPLRAPQAGRSTRRVLARCEASRVL